MYHVSTFGHVAIRQQRKCEVSKTKKYAEAQPRKFKIFRGTLLDITLTVVLPIRVGTKPQHKYL